MNCASTPISQPISNPLISPEPHVQDFVLNGNALSLTYQDAASIKPAAFWQKIQIHVKSATPWTSIEIENRGSMSREKLQKCVDLGIQMSPSQLITWDNLMEEADFWNSNRWNPLFLSVITGRLDQVDFTNPATLSSLNDVDHRNFTLLEYAVALGDIEIARALLDAGANINQPGNGILHQAIWTEDTKMLELLIEKGANLNEKNAAGRPPLERAICFGKFEAIKVLVSKGADLSSVAVSTPSDASALSVAAEYGYFDIIQFLLDNGVKKIDDPQQAASVIEYLIANKLKDYKTIYKTICNVPLDSQLLLRARTPLHIRSVLHSLDIMNTCELHPIDPSLSPTHFDFGTFYPYYLDKLSKTTRVLQQQYPQALNDTDLLRETMDFTLENRYGKESLLLDRILSGKPTLVPTGFFGHYVMVLIWGDYFVICNRGLLSGQSVEVFKFDPQKLNDSILRNILECQVNSKEWYQNLFFQILPKSLNFAEKKLTDLEILIEQLCPLRKQKTGSCSLASLEAAVWTFFVLNLISKHKESSPINKTQLQHSIREESRKFCFWRAFNRTYFIEKYLRTRIVRPPKQDDTTPYYKIDTQLMKTAFKIMKRNPDPRISPLIKKLETARQFT